MPVAGGGFDQCYNAQAAVAAGSLLVVASDVGQAPNDKQQVEPMLDKIGALPEGLGKPESAGRYRLFQRGRLAACEKAGIEPLIAMGRQPHHPPLAERFEAAPEAPQDPTPVEAMAHRLTSPEGRALYALRKQMPEPVFGIIKSALGFRQFLLRGLEGARGEWSLVTMAWNLKRIFASSPPVRGSETRRADYPAYRLQQAQSEPHKARSACEIQKPVRPPSQELSPTGREQSVTTMAAPGLAGAGSPFGASMTIVCSVDVGPATCRPR